MIEGNRSNRTGRAGRAGGAAARRLVLACLLASALAVPAHTATETPPEVETEEESFESKLARIDQALRTNPAGVPEPVREACRNRRNFAMQQARARQPARAERSLDFCFDIMLVPKDGPMPGKVEVQEGPTDEEKRAAAVAEIEKALTLTPDLDRGRDIYGACAMCHEAEGWGLVAGSTPQIAGQHRTVLIKQLADMRAGNRDAFLMLPYASVEAIGGPQAIADVTGYIDSLEMTVENGKGDGKRLDLGEQLYARNCKRCHGPAGEGNASQFVPRIQAQHYNYLLRQFEDIGSAKRRNADPQMTKQIEGFSDKEKRAVLDYVSRLEPPIEMQAPPGWHNPDFPRRNQPPK